MDWPQLWKRDHRKLSEQGIPVSEIVEISRGVRIASAKYSDKQDRDEVAYIRISDIDKGRIRPNKLRYVKIDEISDITRYVVKEGDILFSIRGTIGKVALVDRQFDNSVASSQLAILRPKKKDLNASYLFYILASSTTKKQADLLKRGFIHGLSLKDLGNIRINLPPLEEQQQIVNNIRLEEVRYDEAAQFLQKTMAERISEIMSGIMFHE
jgi:restriction endonuclease S subunit